MPTKQSLDLDRILHKHEESGGVISSLLHAERLEKLETDQEAG